MPPTQKRALTLAELAMPDATTLCYTPPGLSGPTQPAEKVSEWLHSIVAGAELSAGVPDGLGQSFEHLRTLHTHGILCYGSFTVGEENARLVLEQALRVRFFSLNEDGVPVACRGHGEAIPATGFNDDATSQPERGLPALKAETKGLVTEENSPVARPRVVQELARQVVQQPVSSSMERGEESAVDPVRVGH
jgi:hypothetical protein